MTIQTRPLKRQVIIKTTLLLAAAAGLLVGVHHLFWVLIALSPAGAQVNAFGSYGLMHWPVTFPVILLGAAAGVAYNWLFDVSKGARV